MKLTKNQMLFIQCAAQLPSGFLDYENTTIREFEELYGFNKQQADKIATSLDKKMQTELKKIQP